ncbi:riboflavin synthase [Candidatus Gracilibacteria bacterium]|nr:riboflavin synthase [Candidatus Gracilibacteria bacterium]
MFTGIVEQIGKIQKIEKNRFTLSHGYTEPFEIGESIALSGACMTILKTSLIKETGLRIIEIEMMEESRNRTTFKQAQEGDLVNLERSARIGDRNSGHQVTGHIDEVGKILKIEKKSDFWVFRISVSQENEKLVVHKGSIAVDGISLTVSHVSEPNPSSEVKEPGFEIPWFEVSILPYTWGETNLHAKKEGDGVNLEFDIIGKYLLRQNNG